MKKSEDEILNKASNIISTILEDDVHTKEIYSELITYLKSDNISGVDFPRYSGSLSQTIADSIRNGIYKSISENLYEHFKKQN